MNYVARDVGVFEHSAQADRHQLAPHRPSGGSDARGVFGTRIEYVAHPSFDDPDARDAILAPMPGPSADGAARRHRLPVGVRQEIACLYEAPLLSREQETHQFRKMNCLKHLAEQARSRLGPGRPRRRDVEEFERLRIEMAEVRHQIIRANLRLVTSNARRFAGRLSDLAELISVGNLALIRAVDRFDFARGHKFSTYATWAIWNEFRSDRRDQRLRVRFVPACTAILQDTVDTACRPGRTAARSGSARANRRAPAQTSRRPRAADPRRPLRDRRCPRGDPEPDRRGAGNLEGTRAPGRGAGSGPSPQVCPHGRASPLAGPDPTLVSPRANWRAAISQNGQKAKRRRPNRRMRNQQCPRIRGDFVSPDAKAKF